MPIISISPILKVLKFNTNINTNTSKFEKGYQYQYQYLRIPNSIPIPILISKFSKFNINIKTIPKYLDTLRSQDNIKKDRAGIAHLWACRKNVEKTTLPLVEDFFVRIIASTTLPKQIWDLE